MQEPMITISDYGSWGSNTIFVEKLDRKRMKWPYFVNQSTTIMIVDFPFDLGKKMIKSIAMSSNTKSGIDKGWNNPAVS